MLTSMEIVVTEQSGRQFGVQKSFLFQRANSAPRLAVYRGVTAVTLLQQVFVNAGKDFRDSLRHSVDIECEKPKRPLECLDPTTRSKRFLSSPSFRRSYFSLAAQANNTRIL
jgi:hypothetical protein